MTDMLQMQSLPLAAKIRMTANRINAWVDQFGEEGVYISFSGGKDSTVLLDIARNFCGYENIPAVFVDVPTQYPELRDFAMSFKNVEILKPKISFMDVCSKYGFPLISKEICEQVNGARKYLIKIAEEENKTPEEVLADREQLAEMLNEKMAGRKGGSNMRLAIMLGMYTKDKAIQASVSKENKSGFSYERYSFLLHSEFQVSNRCCYVMKKKPAHEYYQKTKRVPITGQTVDESNTRLRHWLAHGCNAFDEKIPISNPMSFWTEQDVLTYIHTYNLPICSIYGDVVIDYEAMGELEGQTFLYETGAEPLKTTGCKRTGCMLCGFGCHLNNDTRFLQLKETHPKMYNLLDVVKNNGVTFREAIEWTNEHGNLDIKL